MGNELKISITKLNADGSNWVMYHNQMLWAISSCVLSKHLTSDTVTQTYTTIGNIGNVMLVMQWNNDQAMVKQMIAISVPDTVFNCIKTGATAKDVWEVLKKLYEGHTMIVMIDLGRWLQTIHCSEGESIREHFEQLADMCEQLTAMGKSIGKDEYALILMGSLPASYAATLSSIAATAEISTTTPTVATVTKLAIDKYDRCTLGNDKSNQAFTVDAKKKGKKGNVECFNCGNKGHIKANSWSKGRGKEGQGPRRKCNSSKEGGKKVDTATCAKQAGKNGKEKEKEKDKEEEIKAWVMVEEEEEESPQIPVMVANEAGGGEMELFDSVASLLQFPFWPLLRRYVGLLFFLSNPSPTWLHCYLMYNTILPLSHVQYNLAVISCTI